jgi:hypothetical protein
MAGPPSGTAGARQSPVAVNRERQLCGGRLALLPAARQLCQEQVREQCMPNIAPGSPTGKIAQVSAAFTRI